MPGRLIPQRLLVILAAATIVLILTLSAVLAVAAILGAMGDQAGSTVLHWIGVGVGILLAVDLLCLLLALAIHAIDRPQEPPEEGPPP